MKVLHKGHRYELSVVNGDAPPVVVQFQNKEPGDECPGVTTQEVIRVLLDRTRYCNNCMPHRVNEEIVYHLRKALVLHEARALERKVDKGQLQPEFISTSHDGHFYFLGRDEQEGETSVLMTTDKPSTREDVPCYEKE